MEKTGKRKKNEVAIYEYIWKIDHGKEETAGLYE